MTGITATPSVCQPSAIVRHTGAFCRGISWHTPPIDGIVLSVHEKKSGPMICLVRWCDDDLPVSILASNLELAPANATIADSMRKCLMQEFEQETNE